MSRIRVRPGRRVIGLILFLLLLAFADLVLRLLQSDETPSPVYWFWLGGLAVVMAVGLLDLGFSRRFPLVGLNRELPLNLAQDRWQVVRYSFTNERTRPLHIELFDLVPHGFEFRDMPRQLDLDAQQSVASSYSVRPLQRGDFAWPGMAVRWWSRWSLWELQVTVELPTQVRVFPDFSWLSRYLMLAGDLRVGALGVRLMQRRGEGMEFQELREFREGDVLRQIDWKATSRRQVLISREYQEERDQQILLVLDTGRRMRAKDDELSHFDHVLRSLLLLSYVALRQGDAVGLLSFGETSRFLPMQRGVGAINTLLRSVYDLDAGTAASDYVAMAADVRARQQRRALVVVLTNVREEDSDLQSALQLLRSQHVVLLTSLRDGALRTQWANAPRNLDDALLLAGAAREVVSRRRFVESLEQGGFRCLDVEPAQLPVALVNDYWRLKRAGRI